VKPPETQRPDLIGDGYDAIPLLTAEDVARWLSVPVKRVYELPLPRVRVGLRSVRWLPEDVHQFIAKRTESV